MIRPSCLLLVALLCSVTSFAQIVFDRGSFVDNDDKVVTCFIKNRDWKYNPIEFDYKLDSIGEVQTIAIDQVKSFSVGALKYVRANVQLDMSGATAGNLSMQQSPEWKDATLFLRVVMEGAANLYYYEAPTLQRFFYNVEAKPIRQLIYKKYVSADRAVKLNRTYIGQLRSEVYCEGVTNPEKTKYKPEEIEAYFLSFNQCKQGSNVNTAAVKNYTLKRKGKFFLKPNIGLSYSDFKIHQSYAGYDVAFDEVLSFRGGVEMEWVLPHNKNKWGLVADAAYRSYKSNGKSNHATPRFEPFEVEYTSIEIPFGVRHYFYMKNPSTRLFADAFVNAFELKGSAGVQSAFGALEISPRPNYAFGVGVLHKRISAEVRYYTPKSILGNYVFYVDRYYNLSVILGYRLL